MSLAFIVIPVYNFDLNLKVKIFEDIMGVYRVIENSASHSVDFEKQFRFEKSNRDIRDFFANRYIVDTKFEDDAYIKFYIYVNALKKKYDKNIAKLMRKEYRKIGKKSAKLLIYFCCSYIFFYSKFYRYYL